MRVRDWLIRRRDAILPALVTIALALLLANLVKHGMLTASRLAANKDALAALQSSVQVVFLAVGAVFSYYRFFRGRTFISRGDICLEVSVIGTPSHVNVCSIVIEFKNLGTTTIWRPRASATIRAFGAGTSTTPDGHWVYLDSPTFASDDASLIDSGETASFTSTVEVSKTMWVLEIEAAVRDADGVLWRRTTIISSQPDATG